MYNAIRSILTLFTGIIALAAGFAMFTMVPYDVMATDVPASYHELVPTNAVDADAYYIFLPAIMVMAGMVCVMLLQSMKRTA